MEEIIIKSWLKDSEKIFVEGSLNGENFGFMCFAGFVLVLNKNKKNRYDLKTEAKQYKNISDIENENAKKIIAYALKEYNEYMFS